MRSPLLIAILLTGAAFAQRSLPPADASNLAPQDPGTLVQGGEVQVKADLVGPASVYLNGGIAEAPLASLDLSRSLIDAIAGNLDKESLERSHGENR